MMGLESDRVVNNTWIRDFAVRPDTDRPHHCVDVVFTQRKSELFHRTSDQTTHTQHSAVQSVDLTMRNKYSEGCIACKQCCSTIDKVFLHSLPLCRRWIRTPINHRCHYDLRKYMFCTRIINTWNSLSSLLVLRTPLRIS